MSDEQARQAFVDTILSEPDVESHRLIYADWLEENGNSKEAEKLRTLPGLAGVWSSDWGTDEFGTWCSFAIPTAAHQQLSASVSQKMRWIEPGTFWMGSPEEEQSDQDDGGQHEVELTQGFWLADTPCTQEMWQAVMGENPSRFQNPRCPVETVCYSDCHSFFDKVSTLIRGLRLLLPTEAQWEYACRAGTLGECYHDDRNAIAWYQDNSEHETHPVGEKLPNAWGLYDILGNVWEWCRDGGREYAKEKVIDPVGPTTETTDHMIRGGGWYYHAAGIRAACRGGDHPDDRYDSLGFRYVSME